MPLLFPFFSVILIYMEAVMVNQILVKLLLLALNLMPLDQAGFNFHVVEDGYYAATYRAERRDQDFTVFRPVTEDEKFPAFDAERSRRFGRTYTVRIQGTGEMVSVVLTDIMMDMPPLSSVPRQILKMTSSDTPAPVAPDTAPAANAQNAPAKEDPATEKSGEEDADAAADGDIRIDGVGRTLFLSVEGQNLTIVAEINAPL
jgi:hypothetical protein